MITVEELIVHSLYHRLVLIRVRRTAEPDVAAGASDESTAAADQTLTPAVSCEAEALSEGLGYLCLGNQHASTENGTSMDSLSDSTLALVNSMRAAGEDVHITRHVQTVVDTGQLQLVRASCCSAEVQTDFEPMWYFQNAPTLSSSDQSEEVAVGSSASVTQASKMIDLRNCDEFSLVHLQDIRSPDAQSFVMLQTGSVDTAAAFVRESSIDVPCSHTDNLEPSEEQFVPASSIPVEIVAAPAMFVGSSRGMWKRELELPNNNQDQGLCQPVDVDSGIWDMMQAFGTAADDSYRSDHSQASSGPAATNTAVSNPVRNPIFPTPEMQNNLQGMYQMFQLADGATDVPSVSSGERDASSSPSSEVRTVNAQTSVGGLSDILEPVAVVDFVVHRVEAETVQLERVDLDSNHSASSPALLQRKTVQQKQQPNGNLVRKDGRRRETQNRPLSSSAERAAELYADASDGSYEDDASAHESGDDAQVRQRQSREVRATAAKKSAAESAKKRNKDVVRITSVRVGRPSRRRFGGRGRTSWMDPQCENRKSMSANVSRSSSFLDVGATEQEMARSSEIFSDPSPEHERQQGANQAASRAVHMLRQPYTSSPYDGHHSSRVSSTGMAFDAAEWFTDGSSSTASAPVMTGFDMFAEPELFNFVKFPHWMRDLPDALQEVPLSEICIPGSHIAVAIERDLRTDLDFSKCNYEMADFLCKLPDLALFNNFRMLMKTIWKAWMPKQCLSVYDQLVAGSRYLDMRVTKLAGQLHGEHGLYSRPLKTYLKDVRRFVEEHPTEVVILHFQSSEYLDRADKRQLVTALFQAFGARMASNTVLSTTDTTRLAFPSLKQLRASEKQVIVFFPSADMELVQNHIFGRLVWSDDMVRIVASPKTQTVAELATSLDVSFHSSGSSTLNLSGGFAGGLPLRVVKAVLSPDMSMVFGRYEYRSMRQLTTYETSSAVTQWVDGRAGLNIVVIDFIGIGDTVDKLLQLNSCRV